MAQGRHIWLAALAIAGALAGSHLSAQDRLQIPSPILTLDQEALFSDSSLAERISREIEQRGEALAAENREIEAKLVAEELELTEKRPSMDPGEFRELADAFDLKVQALRDEQDAKTRELQRMREQARQNFLRRISPILSEIVRERGAVVVLDRRSVFLSADTIDITQLAIDRINAAFDANEIDGTLTTPIPDVPGPDSSLPDPDPPSPEAPILEAPLKP